MNERMIELYQEASDFAYKICREVGREGGSGDHIWNTLSTGKFAELIVRECADVGSKFSQAHPEDICYQIKRHFGVEE